jgi:hypothetical protein
MDPLGEDYLIFTSNEGILADLTEILIQRTVIGRNSLGRSECHASTPFAET